MKKNKLTKFFKAWATPIGTVIAVGTLLWGVISFNLQQQSAQQNELDQQQETTLQTYIDNIQDLLLNHHLLKSTSTDDVAIIARVRTLKTLRRLNSEHNKTLLQFLQDAHLIGLQDAVINLSGATLDGVDLSGADLNGVNLSGTNLGGTNLNGTDLRDATLNGATLNGATLNGANLSGAVLNGANLNGAHLSDALLSGANISDALLSGATLNGADLNGVNLSGSTLNGANLSGATLNGAVLSYATLSNATLNDAVLNGAFLGGATLNGVDLSGASLSNALLNGALLNGADLSYARNLTQRQLDTVYSCTKAKNLSTGLTCHNNRSSSSTVTLTYWYTESQAETPVILQLIQQFEQQNPNIKINAEYKSFGQIQAAFITAAQASNTPDVLRSDVGWVTQFASQGYLLNIDSYVSPRDKSDYLSAPLSYDMYNGHLYGLPQVTDYLALLYNKAELRQVGITSPPTTMAGFEADAMKVVQRKTPPYGFETTGTSYYVLPFLWAFDGGMIDQQNNILVNNAGSVKGLNFLLRLQNTDPNVMPPKGDLSNGSTNMVNDFMRGKTAMIFDGPWDVSNILTGSAFIGNPSNLGIAAIPIGPTGKTGSPLGGQSYVISSGTAHPAEAYKFISFMSSTASQVTIAKANHTLPTRLSAYQDPSVSSNSFIKAFRAFQNTAVARPAIPQGGYLFDAFDPNIQAALDGTKNSTEALNAVADAWKQLLAGS